MSDFQEKQLNWKKYFERDKNIFNNHDFILCRV